MSDSDDLNAVTQGPIPDETAEQLLAGTLAGADANPHLAPLASLFEAARVSGEAGELASLDATVMAFRHALRAQPTQIAAERKRPMIKKLMTAKVAAAIGALTLASVSAAAASGSLPSPFSASRPHIEVTDNTDTTDPAVDDTEVEDTDDTTAPTDTASESSEAADDEATEQEGEGPDATGPAKFGLCTANAARTKHDDTTDDTTAPESTVAEDEDLPIPFQNLADAAAAAGQTVEEFCADATPGGKAADEESPSLTAPGHSEDNPSDTAPGHTEGNPSDTAPGHSDESSSSKGATESADHGRGHAHS
jgi:hypothetical protein